ncbi:Gldg family protein [Pirellulales bacterium]|nr:Gldg family protein [Pirellulales bacterium]
MNFNVLKAIFKRDFVSYFSSPTGYAFICVFVVLGALATFWPPEFFANNLANLDQLSRWLPFIMLVFIPAITMSIWAEERRQGTDELLLTIPASDFDVVLGKYLAGVAIFTVSLLFSGVSIFTVFKYGLGDPDFGLFCSTYLGYWFIGIAMIAIGMVASFMTDNLTVGFILGTLFNLPLALFGVADWFLKDPAVVQAVRRWSALEQFRDFERGVISLGGVAYFVGIAAVMIYLSMVLIGRRHWQAREDGGGLLGHYVVRAFSLLAFVAGATVLVQDHNWLRADVSSERLSSLSPETIRLISELREDEDAFPVVIDAFVSPAVPQEFAAIKLNFLSTLAELSALGGDRISVVKHEIPIYGKDAEKAEKTFGITPHEQLVEDGPEVRQEEFFLGAAFTSGLDRVSVPFINPGVPVEYELVRSILTVSEPKRLTLGLINTDIPAYDASRPEGEVSVLIDELRKQYDVKPVDLSEPLKGSFDVLLAIQPSMLGPQEMDHLVDAIRNDRIPTALLEDPFPRYHNPQTVVGTSQPRQMNMGGMAMFSQPQNIPKGNIEQLWKLLGIEFQPSMIVIQDYAPDVTVRGFQEPAWVFVDGGNGSAEAFGAKSAITSGLNQVLMLFPGYVSQQNDSQMEFEPLLTTGQENSGEVPVFAINPYERMSSDIFAKQGLTRESYVLGAKITGVPEVELEALLDADADAEVDPADLLDAKEKEKSESDEPATDERPMKVVVVSDIDWIVNDFFQLRAAGDDNVLPTAQNVTLLLNILDELAGEDRFIEIRKRAREHRTLKNIDEATEQARIQAQKNEEELVADFKETEEAANEEFKKEVEAIEERTDLNELQKATLLQQTRISAQAKLGAKIKAATAVQRRKIKKTKNDLQQSIRTIQDKYKLFAILIPPIPPLLLALAVFFRRREAERQGVSRERLK